MRVKRLAVFVSGGGSNMQAIMDAIARGEICGEICLVISSRADAYALVRAQNSGIETYVLDKGMSREMQDEKILSLLKEQRIDYCILAGYLSIVSPKMIEEYRNRIVNIHPSLIPSFCGKGYYGHHVHQAVLDYGAKVSGCTVHFVDEGTDTGAIILQQAVPVEQEDTADTLAARILVQEHLLIVRAVRFLCEERLSVEGRRVRIL